MRQLAPSRRAPVALLLALGILLQAAATAAADGSTETGEGGLDIGFYLVVGCMIFVGFTIFAARHRRAQHDRSVELAAAEASDDDPAFDPGFVRRRAAELFDDLQRARSESDRELLATLLAPGLLAEELRQLDQLARKGWRRRVNVLSLDPVRYVGIANRAGESGDRVTVRVFASVYDEVVDADGLPLHEPLDVDGFVSLRHQDDKRPGTEIAEFWTLAKRPGGGDWVVAAIETEEEGRHVLEAPAIATPWGDTQRLAETSVMEVAAIDRLPQEVRAGELVDVDYAHDARLSALDLSLVDGRWAPAVLEASVRQAVAAWAVAVDGGHHDLHQVATPEVAQALLHPGDPTRTTRLVVRGPRVGFLKIAAVDAATHPPRMTVTFEVRGPRYIQDRDTGKVLNGVRWAAVICTERWTFALSGPDEHPWQIVEAATSAHRLLRWIARVQTWGWHLRQLRQRLTRRGGP